jgi:lipid-A-disaccharide synthase
MENPADSPAKGPLIFISAAEPSADLHGASLIRAVHRVRPDVRFVGVCGQAMRDEGCWGVFDMSSRSAMLMAAVRAYGAARRMWATAARHLRTYPFDAAVLIDAPTLHLPLAKRAKRLGVPVFYYIAPQLWAWAEFRTLWVRKRVDKMAVILPFEEPFFRDRGIDADFVGHPLFDTLLARTCDDHLVDAIRGRGSPTVAILPGSRRHVMQEVLPGQLEVAARILSQYPDAQFPVSIANAQVGRVATPLIDRAGLPCSLYTGQNAEVLKSADLALVASGTATLETAYYNTPMVVMYNGSRIGYHMLARWLINTRYFALVNVLANREIVPEFMPYYTSTEPIAEKALALLADEALRAKTSRELAELIQPMLKAGAADNTAALLLEFLAQHSARRQTATIRA